MQSYDPKKSRVGRSDHIIDHSHNDEGPVHLGWDQCNAEKALVTIIHTNDVVEPPHLRLYDHMKNITIFMLSLTSI